MDVLLEAAPDQATRLVTYGDVEDLLDARDQRGEGGNDDPALRLRKKSLEGLSTRPL